MSAFLRERVADSPVRSSSSTCAGRTDAFNVKELHIGPLAETRGDDVGGQRPSADWLR